MLIVNDYIEGANRKLTNPDTLRKINEQIHVSDEAICRHIESLDVLGRGAVSQDILKKLRDFVEHVMFKVYADSTAVDYDYKHIDNAIKFVKTKGQLKFLWKFHAYLQIVASHYTLDPENSERAMLKYYAFLLKIKHFLKATYRLDVLANIDKFPLDLDKNLQEYYEKIASKLTSGNRAADPSSPKSDRYYIHKTKPFFVGQRIFYEITFLPTMGKNNKTSRIIAFTTHEIPKNYAVRLWTVEDSISILGKTMPIFIITQWEIAIRPIEIENFSKIFGERLQSYANSAEVRGLMQFLTQEGFNLVELLCFEDTYYQQTKIRILADSKARVSHFFDLLDRCREIIRKSLPGCNILRYLLYNMDNSIIENQLGDVNSLLSKLYLDYGCKPFDEMPFNSSPKNHNPRLGDLFECIDASGRMHELLARCISNNTEINGQLYTEADELATFGDVASLINTYNSKLYYTHTGRWIKERNKHYYIRGYEDDTISIIQRLIELSSSGVQNYANSINTWLSTATHGVDCLEKEAILRGMFSQSSVAMIYGSAGTGKSTLINHISNLFKDQSKLYLANTNPAVDNMKRRVTVQNDDTDFMTIAKFTSRREKRTSYDIVVIDECSTVSNRDMRAILEKADFSLLVLVGDIYQIEAIRFGNWFGATRGFLPTASVHELKFPHRSRQNKELQIFWDRVRGMDDKVLELIVRQGYSVTLDASIFEPAEPDEIILCLNYDGLYGINNINRFLQEANPNPATLWGLLPYKVGDPVLFNDSDRFSPLIYNNVKGWIVGIKIVDRQIQFDVEVDKPINGLEARFYDFELLPSSVSNRTVIRFLVDDHRNIDEDGEVPLTAVVPFQVAYAVSIHKAQGLEYNSVKIVVTNEIEDRITHSIFYTAITRTREKLKIYWTPEVEKRVLGNIKPRSNDRDIGILRGHSQSGLSIRANT